jgi:hypothetical protein
LLNPHGNTVIIHHDWEPSYSTAVVAFLGGLVLGRERIVTIVVTAAPSRYVRSLNRTTLQASTTLSLRRKEVLEPWFSRNGDVCFVSSRGCSD